MPANDPAAALREALAAHDGATSWPLQQERMPAVINAARSLLSAIPGMLAEAWDAGATAGSTEFDPPLRENPYRKSDGTTAT